MCYSASRSSRPLPTGYDGSLFRSSRLIDVQQWSARNMINRDVVAFIAASTTREAALKAEDEQRLQQLTDATEKANAATKRTRFRTRIALGMFAISTPVIFIAVLAAILSYRASESSTNRLNAVGTEIAATLTPIPETLAFAGTQVGAANTQASVAGTKAKDTANELTPVVATIIAAQGLSQSLAYAAKAESNLQDPKGLKLYTLLYGIRGLNAGYSAEAEAVLVKALENPFDRFLEGDIYDIDRAAYSPDGRFIVAIVGNNSNKVNVWDTLTKIAIQTFAGTNDVRSVIYSPDGRFILTAGCGKSESDKCLAGEVRIWDAATVVELRQFSGHFDLIRDATYSPDGRFIVTASSDKTAQIWDAATGSSLRVLSGHSDIVNRATYSPDGRFIVTASSDGTARIWDAATGLSLRVLSGHSGIVDDSAYSPDGRFIVTASSDGTARIWDVVTGSWLHILSGHTQKLRSAIYSADGQFILTASDDATARLWDAATGAKLQTVFVHLGAVDVARFSPDGHTILTTADDSAGIRLWNMVNVDQKRVLIAHLDDLKVAAYSPSGRFIITTSGDRTARLWDATTGTLLRVLSGHHAYVNSAAFIAILGEDELL
jgi:WD40 repeat protein/heme/copper-type cytochrome/quinol oxidase subunit 3